MEVGYTNSDEQYDDMCSTTSSLEIVDALTDFGEDTTEKEERNREKESPALSVLSCPDLVVVDRGEMDGFQDAMSQSQYAQVVFEDIEDSYCVSNALICSYSLTPGLEQGHGDRIGLYRLPFLQPHESVAYVWACISSESPQKVTFPSTKLPRQEDFYQFQYLRGDNSVAGASIPFQLKGEPGERALQEELGGLENKYTGLLQLSEKLSEELNNKTQSFVVLEQEHKSMMEEAARSKQLESDLEELVASSLGLKQTLKATEETLARTESVLEVTTARLSDAEKALEAKVVEGGRLEARLAEIGDAREERDNMAAMLQKEQKSREILLQEKADLLGALEDGEAMLAATVKSKDLAVEEIRTQVTRQDQLMKELAETQEVSGNALADLVDVRRDAEAREAVVASLGRKLEETERKLREQSSELSLLKEWEMGQQKELQELKNGQEKTKKDACSDMEEGTLSNSLEIHEKCLEDADYRVKMLEKDKVDLEEKVVKLEQEGLELKARLEAGAQHYRKLAAAKEKLEKQQSEGNVAVLEEQVIQLKEELRRSHAAHEQSISNCLKLDEQLRMNSDTTSRHVSSASSIAEVSSFSSLNSGCSNMDSFKIGQAIGSSAAIQPNGGVGDSSEAYKSTGTSTVQQIAQTTCEQPKMFQPSLFQPFSPNLPDPLVPEVTGHNDVPELRPRVPAPYSSTQGTSPEPSGVENNDSIDSMTQEVLCPWCMRKFATNGEELERHVDLHLSEVLDCPVCGKMFEKNLQKEYEEHVQEHFNDQGSNLVDISIRGWDLGID